MSQNGSKALNWPNKIGKLMSMTEKENKARKKENLATKNPENIKNKPEKARK